MMGQISIRLTAGKLQFAADANSPPLPSSAAWSGTKAPLNLSSSEVFLRLFPYRDFLPVLEGKYHLVIIDRDPAEQSADVAFVEGDHRSGKALEE